MFAYLQHFNKETFQNFIETFNNENTQRNYLKMNYSKIHVLNYYIHHCVFFIVKYREINKMYKVIIGYVAEKPLE